MMISFSWDLGEDQVVKVRRLKLVGAVFDVKANGCPHGTLEERWRAVISLRDNNSCHLALLEDHATISFLASFLASRAKVLERGSKDEDIMGFYATRSRAVYKHFGCCRGTQRT